MEAFPFCPFKGGQRGRRCLFIIGAGGGKVLGARRIFFPNIPKLTRKGFCATFAYKFFPAKIIKTLLGVISKKIFMCFSANLGRYFHPDFQIFCPDFQQIKIFWGELAPTASPPPAQLLFITVSWVISQFIKVDLKQIFCSYSGTQKIQKHFV